MDENIKKLEIDIEARNNILKELKVLDNNIKQRVMMMGKYVPRDSISFSLFENKGVYCLSYLCDGSVGTVEFNQL